MRPPLSHADASLVPRFWRRLSKPAGGHLIHIFYTNKINVNDTNQYNMMMGIHFDAAGYVEKKKLKRRQKKSKERKQPRTRLCSLS